MANSTTSKGQEQDPVIPLDQLQPRNCGLVVKVDAAAEDGKRLMAMGVCEGRIIKLEQAGDPMILQVMGSRLGVSKRLGTTVSVIPCKEEVCSSRDETKEEGS